MEGFAHLNPITINKIHPQKILAHEEDARIYMEIGTSQSQPYCKIWYHTFHQHGTQLQIVSLFLSGSTSVFQKSL